MPARPEKKSAGCGERGWRPPRFGRKFHVALAYPGPYRTGMSSLGFQTVLYGFASLADVMAARIFLDDGGEGLLFPDAAVDPRRVDLFAFSIAVENDYPNALKMLSLAGLPLRACDRGEAYPLILAGGIAPSLNPEPLAEFMDALVLGEGEEVLGPVVEALEEGRESGSGREAVLEKLSVTGGVYVPSLYLPDYCPDGRLKSFSARAPAPPTVVRARVRDLDGLPAVSRIIAPGSEFEDLFLLEINRGCGRGCRFCAAGHLLSPLRHRRLETLERAVEEGSRDLQRFGLLGSAVADHPGIIPLMEYIVERGWKFSVSSLRVDRVDSTLLGLLKRGGCRTVTLAPETGSERLRRVINKRITDEQILEAAEESARAGIPDLKLYFMVGLPTETSGDREAIPDLLRRIRHRVVSASRSRGRLGTIAASLSCFVPKAWTPFQWHPFTDVRELKAALGLLAKQVRKIPNVTLTHDVPKWAYVQALLSRGDRRAADILERVHLLGGDWNRALRESPVNPDFFVYRPRESDELLPWDFIGTGLRKERLHREYERALAEGREATA